MAWRWRAASCCSACRPCRRRSFLVSSGAGGFVLFFGGDGPMKSTQTCSVCFAFFLGGGGRESKGLGICEIDIKEKLPKVSSHPQPPAWEKGGKLLVAHLKQTPRFRVHLGSNLRIPKHLPHLVGSNLCGYLPGCGVSVARRRTLKSQS